MPLQISEKEIRRKARAHLKQSNIALIIARQAFVENWMRLRKQLTFRFAENEQARQAYSAMSLKEFEGINARQQWANWRTVPRNLRGNVPSVPLRVIDLCCGVGHSTEVLFAYLADGSDILGLEFNPEFVKIANLRAEKFAAHSKTRVRFHAQSVLEKFCDTDGKEISAGSIDLVNSCGAVGHHFDPQATTLLAQEVQRVVRVGGFAMIDSGPYGTTTDEVVKIFEAHGFKYRSSAKSSVLDLYTQVCLIRVNT